MLLMEITFDSLPQAVSQLCEDVAFIKRFILEKINEPISQPDQLLTIQETAEFLNLQVSTIYGLVSRMQIPYMKKGKRLYFSKTELIECLKAGRKKTTKDLSKQADTYISTKPARNG
ncbi:helix-turn-helix domain-containing protein [Candidatus Nomurabacteria bacterium]|nr:helix-turn-helix domain-containing protein [Candidatus Nomurabacteria bacterium]